MNNRFQHISLTRAAALILSCCFVWSCENDEKKIEEWTKRVEMKEVATNINSQLSQNGKIRATLKAPLMWRVQSDTVYAEFPKSLHCDFYNDSTQIESWLDCKYGKYFESLNKVYLRDSVVVINTKGDTLKTPELWWDQINKTFFTDKPSEYLTKDKKIYPQKGITAAQDFSNIKFNVVTGEVQVKDDGFPQQQ